MGTIGFALTMARRSIGGRKLRSGLTMLGVLVGIMAMVSLLSVGYGLQSQVETTLNLMLGATIVINSYAGIDMPEYVQDFVLQVPGVTGSAPAIISTANIGNRPLTLMGVNQTQSQLYHVTMREGRNLKPGEDTAVILSSVITDDLGVHVNDTIVLSPLGGGVGQTFTVVGISTSIGFGFGVGPMNIACFLSLDAAQKLFGKEGYISTILVTLDDPSLAEQVGNNLRGMFSNCRVIRQEEVMRYAEEITGIINGFLIALGSLSLGVGAIGIMNTIMMSVQERRREIGMLKAVGAERRHILAIFISEALLISFFGGVLGCVAGVASIYLIQWVFVALGIPFAVPAIVSPYVLGSSLLAAVAVGASAGLYPSWAASNVRPVEALRYE